MTRGKAAAAWLLVAAMLAAGFLILTGVDRPFNDEVFHAAQIRLYLADENAILPQLTILPLYHAIVAAVADPLGGGSLPLLRVISFAGSVLVIPAFYLLCRRTAPSDAARRTLILVCIPILFPFFFLLYVDLWALALILLAVERAMAGRALHSVLAILAATALRQPSILFLQMPWICTVVSAGGGLLPLLRTPSKWRQLVKASLPYVLAGLAFLAFVAWNGGVSMGDHERQSITLNLSNFWFMLMVFWILWLPWHLGRIRRIWSQLRRAPVASALLLVLGFLLYWTTFHNSHPYNQFSPHYFLRNAALVEMFRQDWIRVLAFVPVAWSLLSLWVTPLGERRFYHLYWIAFLSLLPLPLIEVRYYLPLFALWLAFRSPADSLSRPRTEWATLLWMAALSLGMVWGISRGDFFP